MSTLAERVQLGTIFLDDVRPGWAGQINLNELELANPASCVIGQVFDDPNATYSAWMRGSWEAHDWLEAKGLLTDNDNVPVLLGFERLGVFDYESSTETYEDLQAAWTEVILSRVQ